VGNKRPTVRRSKSVVRIDWLYNEGLRLVTREMKCLDDIAGVYPGGKLPAAMAKDLRDYIKLLSEMKEFQLKRQDDRRKATETAIGGLSEEALEERIRNAQKG